MKETKVLVFSPFASRVRTKKEIETREAVLNLSQTSIFQWKKKKRAPHSQSKNELRKSKRCSCEKQFSSTERADRCMTMARREEFFRFHANYSGIRRRKKFRKHSMVEYGTERFGSLVTLLYCASKGTNGHFPF